MLGNEMDSPPPIDIRLSATIVKFDGWANCIVTLTLESKNLDQIFLSVLTRVKPITATRPYRSHPGF